MIEVVFFSIIGIFSLWILSMYFNIFFEYKATNIGKWIIWGMVLIAWTFKDYNRGWTPIVNIIISIILSFFIATFLYEGNIIVKFLYAVLLNMFWMGAELVVGYCFILLGIEYSKTVWAGTVFSMFITVIFVRILALSFNDKAKEIVSKKYIWYMVFTTCTSVFVTHSLFYICNDYIYNIELAYASSFLLIIVNVLNFGIYTKLSEEYEIKRENTVYAQQVEFYKKYISEREEMLLQIREGQHDIKNKWIFILGLLNNDEVGKAKKFIMDSIRDDEGFETKMKLSRSNNIVIDSMINYKLSIAEKENIKLDVKVNIWMDIPVDNEDICVLLGNALDNAIEATMQVEETRRFINLYIYCIKDTLVITLMNSYDKTVHNVDGKLLSTKKDRENHGIGLSSIKKVVDKYNGTFLIEELEAFCLKIILYL